MPSYVVTGASRGIGLGFIRHLSAESQNSVFALVRDPSKAEELDAFVNSEANKNKNVIVLHGDLCDFRTIKSAAEAVSKATGGVLDVLINNGAILHYERNDLTLDKFPDEETLEADLLNFFKTNVVGVTHTINAFLPLLRAGKTKRVLVVSSAMGSPYYVLKTSRSNVGAYGISKAGVNMVVAKFAATCKDEGFIFLAVAPGIVMTKPGFEKQYAAVVALNRKANPSFADAATVEQSVKEQLALLERMTSADSGAFLLVSGEDANSVN